MQAIWFFASGMTGMAVSGAGGVPCWIIAKRWCHLGASRPRKRQRYQIAAALILSAASAILGRVRLRSSSVGQFLPNYILSYNFITAIYVVTIIANIIGIELYVVSSNVRYAVKIA